MSWMVLSDIERWLRNAGKDKVIFFSHNEKGFRVDVEDADGCVEGRASTLAGAIDQAMRSLQERVSAPKLLKTPEAPAKTPNTTYPTCPACGSYPQIVFCDGRAQCRCGTNNWTMQLNVGTRVKLTTGLVFEYDGALWDELKP